MLNIECLSVSVVAEFNQLKGRRMRHLPNTLSMVSSSFPNQKKRKALLVIILIYSIYKHFLIFIYGIFWRMHTNGNKWVRQETVVGLLKMLNFKCHEFLQTQKRPKTSIDCMQCPRFFFACFSRFSFSSMCNCT